MTKEEREKAIDLLDNLVGMIEDNQNNDYDFALKKGIEALKQEDVIDKIRADIKALSPEPTAEDVVDGNPTKDAVWEILIEVLKIIDKYDQSSSEIPTGSTTKNNLGVDCISRDEVCRYVAEFGNHEFSTREEEELIDNIIPGIEHLSSVTPQEPKTEQFAKWVATEILDDDWKYNRYVFAEIACRKLAKLGIVRKNGDTWELVEPQESEVGE